jgi:hypothetical protein
MTVVPKALGYLYYRMNWWNTDVMKNQIFIPMSNVLGISAIQIVNITCIAHLIFIYLKSDYGNYYSTFIQCIIIGITILINSLVFLPNKRYEKIVESFSTIDKSTQRAYDYVLVAYIICSLLLVISTIVIGRNYYMA